MSKEKRNAKKRKNYKVRCNLQKTWGCEYIGYLGIVFYFVNEKKAKKKGGSGISQKKKENRS